MFAATDEARSPREGVEAMEDTMRGINRGYGQYDKTPKQRMEEYIHKGASAAAGTVNRILSEVPRDRVVRAKAQRITAHEPPGLRMVFSQGGQGDLLTLHPNALEQVCGRLDFPSKYARDLDSQGQWGRELLAHNLNTLVAERVKEDRRWLVRSYQGEARAVLSDRFRRIDSRPVLDALLGGVQKVGGVVAEGWSSEVRVRLTVIRPEVFEPVEGDPIVFGFRYTNSDYGRGAHDIETFIMRLWCLNGIIGQSVVRQVHLGRRLEEEIEYSEETYRLDTAATVSATRDVVSGILSDERVNRAVGVIREAHEQAVDPDAMLRRYHKVLTKKETQAIAEKYRSADVVDLPAGNSTWRFANAVSWLANQTEDQERSMELQKVAGQSMGLDSLAAAA